MGFIYRQAALILQPDQTYDLYMGVDDSYQAPLLKRSSGIKTSDGGKVISFMHPVYGPIEYKLKSEYTGNPADVNKALRVNWPPWMDTKITEAYKNAAVGNSGTSSDPVKWIEEYNRLANRNVTKRLFNLDTLFDLKTTWEELQHHLNQSNTAKRTLIMQGTERKLPSNIHQKSHIELAALHDRLGNSTMTYDYDLLSVAPADLSGGNQGKLLTVKYDFRKANEQNKVTLFDHVKISGTGTELDNVPHFKVSKYFHSGYGNAIFGAQLDELNFQVGLRAPLKLDADSSVNVTYNNKTYNATIKAGYYYPTELALELTQQLQKRGCQFKVIFLNDVDFNGNLRYLQDSTPRYVVVSETEHSVAFSGDNHLVNTVLNLDSLTLDVSGSPLLNSGKKYYIHKGGINIKTFDPMLLNLSNASGKLSVTHGNACTTDSPRNYYATLADMIFSAMFEEHTNFQFKVAFDVDMEFYVPETWELYEMFIDDTYNFSKMILSEQGTANIYHRQLLNTPALEFGVGVAGPPGKSGTNLELMASKRFDAPYGSLLGFDVGNNLYNNGGFTFKNYLENTYQMLKEEIYSLKADGVTPNILLTQRIAQDDIWNTLEGISNEMLQDVVIDPAQIPVPPPATPGFYKLEMFDSWGDGWSGASLVIMDGAGVVVYTAPAFTQDQGGYAFDMIDASLFSTGNYTVICGGGSYDSEIGWKLLAENGYAAAMGVVGSTTVPFPLVGEGFLFSDLSDTDLVYHSYTVLKKNRYGILKDSVVQKLLPDVSNAKVGYAYAIDCDFTDTFPYNQDGLTTLMHKLFTDNSVNIVVCDVRGNSGGEVNSRRYCPFGPKNVGEPWQFVVKTEENLSANRYERVWEERDWIRAYNSDPSGHPESWGPQVAFAASRFVDASLNLKNWAYKFSNTAFYEGISGEPLKLAYLQTLTSISSSRSLQMRLNTMADSSGNIYDLNGNLSTKLVMVGVTGSTFATGGAYPNEKHANPENDSRKNAILNYQVAPVKDRLQPVSMFYKDVECDDLIGEVYNQDAITDHDYDKFLIEIGLKTTSEITGVSYNDPTTWRDLQLEKAVKCAALGKPVLDNTPNSAYGKVLTDVVQTMF